VASSLTLNIALVFVFACLLALLGATALRAGVRALGDWLVAWTAHVAASGFALVALETPTVQPVVYLFSALVAPMMLMGAYAHVNREPNPWIPSLGVALGLARALAHDQIGPEAASWIAMLVEPAFAFYAAYLVAVHHERESRPIGDAFLIGGFLLYGCVEVVDASIQFTPGDRWILWGSWIVLGMPLLATQMILYLSRISRSAASNEQPVSFHENRLQILTESNDSIVVEYDELGTLTYLSKNAEAVMDRPVEATLGRNVRDYFERDRDSVIKLALEEKGYITEEDVLASSTSPQKARLANGDTYYYEANRTTYRTEGGELRILSQARNITERIMREETIRESERRLNRAEEIGSFGSWEFSAAENEIYWSAHLYRMHGLEPTAGPLNRARIRQLLEADDLTNMVDNTLSRIEGNRFPEFEYRIRRADDGRIRTLRTIGEIEYGPDGKLVRVSGASIDITEQIELQSALLRGRRYLDVFVNSNIMGVFYTDSTGQIVEANDAFLSLLGFKKSELPLDGRAITAPESHERDEQAVADIRKTGTALPYEKTFLTRDGESISIVTSCARLEPDRVLVIALDISERKRAEAYIEAEKRSLEDTVAERTRELLQSRLRLHEAQRLATIGTLAAGVAHQINNPIGAILNSSEYALLCRGDDDATLAFEQALERNRDEARRCAQIVRSMLQFARDEPTEKWTDDLNRIVRHAHRAVSPYAKDRDAEVEIRAPEYEIQAYISPIEIEQAIVNILRNAIESRTSGARIILSLTKRRDVAEIEITDDGRGIAAEDQEQLFDPFFSTRTREGGTGLGLSVAHGIAKDHSGEIRVDSTPEKGTRVVLSLPLAAADAASGD